uniref:Uncharacterized protein n=1 Tax=Arundo donax TaxID=35708 RepID=A0A0A8Y3R8_ARUDO
MANLYMMHLFLVKTVSMRSWFPVINVCSGNFGSSMAAYM